MHSDNKTNNCWVRTGWSFPSRGMELLIKCWRRGGMPRGSATKIYKMQQQYSGMATFVLKVFCIAFVATICYSYSYPFHFPWVRTPVPMNMSHLGATTCQELHVPSNKPNASPGFTPIFVDPTWCNNNNNNNGGKQLEVFVAPNVGPSTASSPPFLPFCSQAPQFARDILYTHTLVHTHTDNPLSPSLTARPGGNVFVIL